MPNGQVAPFITTAWLDQLRAKNHYLGLLQSDPRITTDPLSVEIIGNAYRRPLVPFERIDQILRNALPATWAMGPMSRVAGVASFDKPFNGIWQFWLPLAEPVDYPSGGSYSVAKGDMFVGIDT